MNQVADAFRSVSSNPSSSSSPTDNNFDMDDLISPIVIFYISLVSIIFFVISLLHLLIRFLLKPRPLNDTAYDDEENVSLFNLHNSGVDQSFIYALPLIHYKTIIGLGQDPFDCAVCLNEFNAEEELRLLPKCSHAFHMDCIDTWLLTNSTCPLCRDNILLSDTPRSPSHIVLELEFSDDESSRESDFHLESTHLDDAASKSDDISGQNDDDFPATRTNSLTLKTRDIFWHAWRRYKLLDSSSLVNDCVETNLCV